MKFDNQNIEKPRNDDDIDEQFIAILFESIYIFSFQIIERRIKILRRKLQLA